MIETTVSSALEPHVLVRMAGIPAARLRALRLTHTVALVDALLDAGAALERCRDEACARLHEAARLCVDEKQRARIIETKRSVFNGRAVGDGDAALDDWRAALRDVQALRKAVAETLGDEEREKRALLRELTRDADLRDGIAGSNPPFVRELDHYGALDAEAPLRKRERQAETTIALYLARAAARPTPFGTLAAAGHAYLTEDGAAPRLATSRASRRRVSRLSHALLTAAARAMSVDAEVRGELPVVVNPTLTLHDGRAEWMKSVPRPLREDDVAVATNDSFAEAALTEDLAALIERLRARRDGVTLRALAHELMPGDEAGALAMLARLVDAGLLETRVPVADNDDHYARRLAGALEATRRPRAVAVAEALRADDPDALRAAAALPPAAAAKRLRYADEALRFDDVVLPRAAFAVDDLALWTRVVRLFDLSSVQKLLAASFFDEHYGDRERVPLVTFYRHYFRTFRAAAPGLLAQRDERGDGWHRAILPFRSSAGLERLSAAHERVMRFFARQIAGARGGEAIIDGDALARLLDDVDPRLFSRAPVAFLVQLAGTTLAVNQELPGGGKAFGRWLGLAGDARLVDSVRRSVAALGGGARVAEMGGVFGYSGNLRPSVSDVAIDYPGSVAAVHDTIPIGDLALRRAGDERLAFVSMRDGREVVPVDTSFILFSMQPPLYQFTAQLSPASALPTNPLRVAAAGAGPRVRLGNLVVQRRRFTAADIPCDGAVAVRRWQRAHEIPDDVWVLPSEESGKATPFYVDFANPFLLAALRRSLRRGERIVLEEVFPALEETPVRCSGEPHVSELLIELQSQPAAGGDV